MNTKYLVCLVLSADIWWPMNRRKLENTPGKYIQACTYEHGQIVRQTAKYFVYKQDLNTILSSATYRWGFHPCFSYFHQDLCSEGRGGGEEVGTRMWNQCPSWPQSPSVLLCLFATEISLSVSITFTWFVPHGGIFRGSLSLLINETVMNNPMHASFHTHTIIS